MSNHYAAIGLPVQSHDEASHLIEVGAGGEGRDGGEEGHPLVFSVPDFVVHAGRTTPFAATARIAAFPDQVELFDTLSAYEGSDRSWLGSEKGKGFRLSPQVFIPTGMFARSATAGPPPEPRATFGGFIRRVEERVNSLLGGRFTWLEVEGSLGTYDVVIEPDALPGEPVVDGIVFGDFWLIGRPDPGVDRRRGGFQSIGSWFGRRGGG